jgi:hypothetical protein
VERRTDGVPVGTSVEGATLAPTERNRLVGAAMGVDKHERFRPMKEKRSGTSGKRVKQRAFMEKLG